MTSFKRFIEQILGLFSLNNILHALKLPEQQQPSGDFLCNYEVQLFVPITVMMVENNKQLKPQTPPLNIYYYAHIYSDWLQSLRSLRLLAAQDMASS